MHPHLGVWIDHRRAVIVFPSQLNQEAAIILSHAARHRRRAEDVLLTEPHEPLRVQADDVQERRFQQQLQNFYDEVIAVVHGAASLFVFGPGEAKGELVKRLAHEKPSPRRVSVETTDQMSERQIAAKVGEHLQGGAPEIVSSRLG